MYLVQFASQKIGFWSGEKRRVESNLLRTNIVRPPQLRAKATNIGQSYFSPFLIRGTCWFLSLSSLIPEISFFTAEGVKNRIYFRGAQECSLCANLAGKERSICLGIAFKSIQNGENKLFAAFGSKVIETHQWRWLIAVLNIFFRIFPPFFKGHFLSHIKDGYSELNIWSYFYN